MAWALWHLAQTLAFMEKGHPQEYLEMLFVKSVLNGCWQFVIKTLRIHNNWTRSVCKVKCQLNCPLQLFNCSLSEFYVKLWLCCFSVEWSNYGLCQALHRWFFRGLKGSRSCFHKLWQLEEPLLHLNWSLQLFEEPLVALEAVALLHFSSDHVPYHLFCTDYRERHFVQTELYLRQ